MPEDTPGYPVAPAYTTPRRRDHIYVSRLKKAGRLESQGRGRYVLPLERGVGSVGTVGNEGTKAGASYTSNASNAPLEEHSRSDNPWRSLPEEPPEDDDCQLDIDGRRHPIPSRT